MVKIHLGVCGIGFGHSARAVAIAKALKDQGWSLTISSYDEGLEYLKRFNLDVYRVPGVSYGILSEGKVSIKMTIFKNIFMPVKIAEQVSHEITLIDRETDLVISDTRASTVIAAKILGKPVLTILNQFNIKILYPRYRWIIQSLEAAAYIVSRIWLMSDKILVADYPPPLTISKKNLVFPKDLDDEKVKYIGPIINDVVLDLPDAEYLKYKYGVGLDGKPVILFKATGPLYERKILIDKMLPILKKLSREFEVVVTLGGMKLDSPPNDRDLKIYEWVEEPLELVKIADVVITRAGQTTLSKILALGKPLIMIPIPGHAEQVSNAESVEEAEAGIKIDEEELSEDVIRDAIDDILDSKYYEKASLYASTYRSLNPIKSVVEEVRLLFNK
ncbi:MAG: UDP-N-acetylglucosamine--N-acetylmuramyl-(pentapeptide) pyrophosphoryl-undecaprenol N-acetylglucosamine transferase [Nitrososphaeria archaeon]|nr:UDP-N-acetylglucosamine--N-acetylmuramyl-(pentapeptide) pyrophosphoryl-undecaprenol N-acetylglucosamine transferase [Nitrososphaeria archaeon]